MHATPNNKAVGAFVDKVKAALAHPYAAHIDGAVYTNDRNFRVWGSAKSGKHNPLKLVAPASALGLPDEAKLCRTLIGALRHDEADGAGSPLAPHVMLVYHQLGADTPAALGAGVFVSAVPPLWDELVADARAWIDRRHRYRRLTVKKMGPVSLEFNLQGADLACPAIGRTHKKNGVWFHVDVRAKMMRFKCQDRECKFKCWGIREAPRAWRWPPPSLADALPPAPPAAPAARGARRSALV